MSSSGPAAFLGNRYSNDAEVYDELWSPVIRPAGEALVDAMDLADVGRVLDAGAGTGALAPAIRRAAPGAAVVGLDLAPGMLDLARRRRALAAAVADAGAMPFAGGTFGAVLLAYVLFHLRRPELAIAEAVRVVRPGGAVGSVTWVSEGAVPAGALLEAALDEAGAPQAPWTGDHEPLSSPSKVGTLLERAGLQVGDAWTQEVEWQFTAQDFWRLRTAGGNSGWRLRQLQPAPRADVLARFRPRVEELGEAELLYRGEVVVALGRKP